uniref:Uncharacterized protein n=1 Tax=Arundo donax TaxID=35708 RepID=A0A0A9GC21_ARUDO
MMQDALFPDPASGCRYLWSRLIGLPKSTVVVHTEGTCMDGSYCLCDLIHVTLMLIRLIPEMIDPSPVTNIMCCQGTSQWSCLSVTKFVDETLFTH